MAPPLDAWPRSSPRPCGRPGCAAARTCRTTSGQVHGGTGAPRTARSDHRRRAGRRPGPRDGFPSRARVLPTKVTRASTRGRTIRTGAWPSRSPVCPRGPRAPIARRCDPGCRVTAATRRQPPNGVPSHPVSRDLCRSGRDRGPVPARVLTADRQPPDHRRSRRRAPRGRAGVSSASAPRVIRAITARRRDPAAGQRGHATR